MAESRAARGNRGFSQPRSIFLVPDSPWDLFPLLIRPASHIFSPNPHQKRQALGLINCLLQRSDGCLDFFFFFLTLSIVYLDFRSFAVTFNAPFFFFNTRSKILVTYGIFTGQAMNWGVLLLATRRPCHEWLPRWPPATPSCWDLHFLPHARTHGETVDKAERESFEGDFFFFHAHPICLYEYVYNDVMSVTDSDWV